MAVAPQLNLVAQVSTSGGNYTYWNSIAFERTYGEPISHLTLSVAEPGQNVPGWSNQQLAVMQQATATFAGQPVINGMIDLRQVIYDKESHQVQIRVASNTINADASTVDPATDGQGGQFSNQTFIQIAQAIMQKCNVTVKVARNPQGADLPFEAASVGNGETRIQFVNRLASMRDLHAVDDTNGTLVYGRPGDNPSGSGLSFVEGQNILAARSIQQANLQVPQINVKGSQKGTDDNNGSTAAQVLATATNSNYKGPPRPFTLMMEHTASIPEAQLRANHEMSLINLQQFDVVITVQGWLAPSGQLWSNFIGNSVSLYSPMIMPLGTAYAGLLIKGTKLMQDNEGGTRTDISLCIPQGLGNGAPMINPIALGG
jgi:prophage tail gpP-like protein